jgi:hypothetical protein
MLNAAYCGKYAAVQALLTNGADPSIKDSVRVVSSRACIERSYLSLFGLCGILFDCICNLRRCCEVACTCWLWGIGWR